MNQKFKECKACGSKMYENASVCPTCGYKTPVYNRLWFWIVIILIFGIVIYYLLPINHIYPFVKEVKVVEQVADAAPVVEATAEPTQTADGYTPIKTDELLLQLQEDPSTVKCYENCDLLIQGYVSTLDENNQYVFLISGMEDNYYYSNFYIYISEEQKELLTYYYTYGDVITAYVHCNEVDDYYGFFCDLNWFVS